MHDLEKIKPAYLALIDLLREHRIKTLGKTGLLRVPKKALAEIATPARLRIMIDALIADGVLAAIETKSKRLPLMEEKADLVFNCTQTAEQIQIYKRSLIIDGALGIQVDDHGGNYYEMYRNGHDLKPIRLSNDEGKLLHYLIDHANVAIERRALALMFRWTVPQISSRLNTIRRKLMRLGFSEEHVLRILPSYLRGQIVFQLV